VRTRKSKVTLHVAKLILFLPLVLYLVFVALEKRGYWDHLRGLDLAQQIAERFEKSVGPDDAIPVRAGEREFEPIIALIREYSATKLADDKTPQVIARFQAKVYDAQLLGESGILAQWTSPATPIAVLYVDWPHEKIPNNSVPVGQYAIVGTLGNLHEWIARSHEDFHFWIVDLLLVGVVPLMVGLYEYFVELRYEK
jgi:hypothetical protein